MLSNISQPIFKRGRDTILWDGDCGFCRRSKELAEKLDRADFLYEPYQSFSEAELKTVGLSHRRCERELQIVSRSGRTFGGAFSLNYFLWRQPHLRAFVLLTCIFPVLFLMEVLAYKLVADNRTLFSKILFPKG